MQFVSPHFLIFFVLLMLVLKLCKSEKHRQMILLFASYTFYAYWDYRFLFLLFVQTACAYLTGIGLKRKYTKRIAACGIAVTLAILAFFKYFNFFTDAFCSAFGVENTISLNIILPVGISFYTFQAISYIIDVYRGNIGAESAFEKMALYIGFFHSLCQAPL